MIALLALGALALATAAFAAGRLRVPVTLKVVGATDLTTGQPTRVTATARLPVGTHLLIQATALGKPAAKLIECVRSPCSAAYRRITEGDVAFQASVIKRAGAKVTTFGRSTKVSVFWSEPLPPPPPAATPGHFAGTIGNAASPIMFDIGPDGLSARNWSTGEIDESCDGGQYTFAFSGAHATGPYPVATDGTFAISFSSSSPTLDYNLKFTAKVTGGTAAGILHVESSYLLSDGNRLNCSSSDQPWTATRTG